MNVAGQIDIFTKWDAYGFVATSPDKPGLESAHCEGPRSAAENLSVQLFGVHYQLTFVRRGYYQVKEVA